MTTRKANARSVSSPLFLACVMGLQLGLILLHHPAAANVSLKETIKFMYDSGYGATAVASSLSAGLIADREAGREIRESDVSPVWDATERDFIAVVGPGVSMITVREKDGSTVLMQLVKFMGKEKGNSDRERLHAMLIKLLIQKGADIKAKNSQGKTALLYAKEYGLPEIIRLLQQAGARE